MISGRHDDVHANGQMAATESKRLANPTLEQNTAGRFADTRSNGQSKS